MASIVVSTNLSQGLAELATRAAVKRMSDQAGAKAAAAKSGLDLTTQMKRRQVSLVRAAE
jgi:hypothetical protein